ncbi:putative receptor protein kinase [Spatholobus suberectus]|nr:putative receptor protein kinase [Spatholobus suberectus]
MKFAPSWAVDTGCSLKIQLSPLLNDSGCDEGDWDGILHSKCCGAAFDAYLYALGRADSRKTNVKVEKIEADLCRTAVLVTLISNKIENVIYLKAVLRCPRAQHIYSENQTSKGNNQKMNSNRGIWILTGAIIWVILIEVITACFMLLQISPTRKEDILRKTACPRVPIKEVYAATYHLNEMNIIGKGPAGI